MCMSALQRSPAAPSSENNVPAFPTCPFALKPSPASLVDVQDSMLTSPRTPLQMAKEHIYWHRPYSTVMAGSFEAGDVQWFPEGGLNVSYNCVDRWAYKHPNKVRFCASCRA